jgi:pyruvate dehydrogenase E2 component (dihydrolipoamide acetyltransferase)
MSPLARRRAAELGVDPATVTGTGDDGIIEGADIERAAAAKSTPPPAPGDAMRRAIAAAMAKSKREIPHYYLQARIDMSRALAWLEAENQKRPITGRLLPAVLLLKAVARSLRDVPALNGFWKDDRVQLASGVHLGFAISMKGGGLVAPAIHDVDGLTIDEIMAALRDLIPRARSGRLRSSEMTDATLTVTSLGELGAESVFGVIYPPQVGLVGFGRILEQPWAQNGMLGVRPVLTASLSADHRATDGHIGAQFLDALSKHLQTPESL